VSTSQSRRGLIIRKHTRPVPSVGELLYSRQGESMITNLCLSTTGWMIEDVGLTGWYFAILVVENCWWLIGNPSAANLLATNLSATNPSATNLSATNLSATNLLATNLSATKPLGFGDCSLLLDPCPLILAFSITSQCATQLSTWSSCTSLSPQDYYLPSSLSIWIPKLPQII